MRTLSCELGLPLINVNVTSHLQIMMAHTDTNSFILERFVASLERFEREIDSVHRFTQKWIEILYLRCISSFFICTSVYIARMILKHALDEDEGFC